jgi:putative hemolysin
MFMDIALLLSLILLNGLFALSEIAIVSSRRARLVQMADGGSSGARRALALTSEPTRFLSSVQIGITTIGILSGAIGEAVLARRFQPIFERVPVMAPYAETLSLTVMVIALTYVSLVLGELVPKRLALTRPETLASFVARPMDLLANVGRPFVTLLSVSTDTILRLLGVRAVKPPAVTLEEIKVLLELGADEGIVEQTEHTMVTNVLNLDDRHVSNVLTPRSEVVFLDVQDSVEVVRDKLRHDSHNVLPLCDGGLDRVVGAVRPTKVLAQLLDGGVLELPAIAEKPLFVPETMTLMTLLEQFKRTHLPMALVVDEFGGVEGLVSLTDVVSAIVGELPMEAHEDAAIIRRDDGSWLVDGALDADVALRALGVALLSNADRQHYHTVGGLAMQALGRVPKTGDVFERAGLRIEVVDMDGNRVDRVLVRRSNAS